MARRAPDNVDFGFLAEPQQPLTDDELFDILGFDVAIAADENLGILQRERREFLRARGNKVFNPVTRQFVVPGNRNRILALEDLDRRLAVVRQEVAIMAPPDIRAGVPFLLNPAVNRQVRATPTLLEGLQEASDKAQRKLRKTQVLLSKFTPPGFLGIVHNPVTGRNVKATNRKRQRDLQATREALDVAKREAKRLETAAEKALGGIATVKEGAEFKILRGGGDLTPQAQIDSLLDQHSGKRIRVTITKDGGVIKTFQILIPNLKGERDNISRIVAIKIADSYNDPLWDDPGVQFFLTEGAQVGVAGLGQLFADAPLSHCLITPIREWAQGCFDRAVATNKNRNTMNRYSAIIRKCDEFVVEYEKGVPQQDMQKLADSLQVKITVHMPVTNTPLLVVTSEKKPLRSFKFMNTRWNHVDETVSFDRVDTTQENLDSIARRLEHSNKFHVRQQSSIGQLRSVSTLEGYWGVRTDFQSKCQEYRTGHGFDVIEMPVNSQASKFVKQGCLSAGTFVTRLFGNGTIIDQIDQERSYFRSEEYPHFEGYPGKITDLRECSSIHGPGYYRVHSIVLSYAVTRLPLEVVMSFTSGIYPSPILKWLTRNGCTFVITGGAWGPRFDFKMPEWMENRLDGGPRGYQVFVGMMYSKNDEIEYILRGSREYLGVLSSCSACSVVSFGDTTEATLIVKKENPKWTPQVYGFVTAYSLLRTLDQLLLIPACDVISVCVDGINTSAPVTSLAPSFRHKDGLPIYNGEAQFFFPCDDGMKLPSCSFIVPQISFHVGAGGCGKTHAALTAPGLVDVMYFAHSHKLANAKKEQYSTDSYTLPVAAWQKLVGRNPETPKEVNKFSTLVLDEASMMSNSNFIEICARFPHHKIIVCGDFEAQELPVTGVQIFPLVNVVRYTKNWRTTDAKLLQALSILRENIDIMPKDQIELIRHIVPFASQEEIVATYTLETTILCPRVVQISRWNKLLPGFNKWRVEIKSGMYSRGSVVIGDRPLTKCSLANAFTIHSIQGETCVGPLVIDARGIFSTRGLYTALSRARLLSQVRIVC